MNCPYCSHVVAGNPEFCPACGRILPVSEGRSAYEVLGYDREMLDIDLQDLESRLFRLSKKFHPDRFAGKTAQEIQYSHDHSSAINNAYRTLKSTVLRAKYAVEKELGSIEEKSESVPADMADLFFEVHEHLDTIRDSNGNAPEDAIRCVQEAEADLRQKVGELEQKLQEKFVIHDRQPSRVILEEIKEILSHRSYMQSFLRQIDNVLGRD